MRVMFDLLMGKVLGSRFWVLRFTPMKLHWNVECRMSNDE
ncbi:hypothetical protein D1AOALGA4SA_8808 [Olavius algarvensis Delta 1 endosymbiont]|nr:hypothetical protein D1AOALGA4SA_8808 [Olavius algarvensis Delta 1 endosymbiont]